MEKDIKKLVSWIAKMEENKLYVEAMERIKNSKDEDLTSMEDIVKEEGLDMQEIEKLADKQEIVGTKNHKALGALNKYANKSVRKNEREIISKEIIKKYK